MAALAARASVVTLVTNKAALAALAARAVEVTVKVTLPCSEWRLWRPGGRWQTKHSVGYVCHNMQLCNSLEVCQGKYD